MGYGRNPRSDNNSVEHLLSDFIQLECINSRDWYDLLRANHSRWNPDRLRGVDVLRHRPWDVGHGVHHASIAVRPSVPNWIVRRYVAHPQRRPEFGIIGGNV